MRILVAAALAWLPVAGPAPAASSPPAAAASAPARLSVTSAGTAVAARPETTVTAPNPVTVTNVSSAEVPGFLVTLLVPDQPDPAGVTISPELPGCPTLSCSFPAPLAAGASFTLPERLRAVVRAGAVGERREVRYLVTPLDDPDATPAAGALTIDLAINLRAVGGSFGGRTGEERQITLGAENRGPFPLGDRGPGGPVPVLEFTVPPGASVVTVPRGCAAVTEQRLYRCPVVRRPDLAVGDIRLFVFTLTVAPARGEVRVVWAPDAGPADNAAPVELGEPVPPTTGPPPARAPVLAETGVRLTGYLLAGVVLVLTGLALRFLARRRRP